MKTKLALLALTAAAAAALPVAVAALPPAQAWEIGPFIRGRDYSVGMPDRPSPARGGGWFFDFPHPTAAAGHVHYLTYRTGPLTGAREIVLHYRIDAPRNTRFVAQQRPDQPATISLFFQRRGDSWSGRGRFSEYRWYSIAMAPVTPGEHRFAVRLDAPWTPVSGGTNAELHAGFAAALANAERVGFVFGSDAGRGHGVYATAPARFTLIDFEVR